MLVLVLVLEKQRKRSNVQRPTSNIEWSNPASRIKNPASEVRSQKSENREQPHDLSFAAAPSCIGSSFDGTTMWRPAGLCVV
jgi:hypothetical protein